MGLGDRAGLVQATHHIYGPLVSTQHISATTSRVAPIRTRSGSSRVKSVARLHTLMPEKKSAIAYPEIPMRKE